MKLKIFTIISSLIAGIPALGSSSTQKLGDLSTEHRSFQNITYEKALEILGRHRPIQYGEPIEITANEQENSVDISGFDGVTVRADLEVALSQPNKVDVTK